MTKSTVREVEQKLRKNIEAALRAGWCPAPNNYTTPDGSFCAVGACVRDVEADEEGDRQSKAACRRLGVTENELCEITSGFDGAFNTNVYGGGGPWYKLGRRLREDYDVRAEANDEDISF